MSDVSVGCRQALTPLTQICESVSKDQYLYCPCTCMRGQRELLDVSLVDENMSVETAAAAYMHVLSVTADKKKKQNWQGVAASAHLF